jgi:hypothetical protein
MANQIKANQIKQEKQDKWDQTKGKNKWKWSAEIFQLWRSPKVHPHLSVQHVLQLLYKLDNRNHIVLAHEWE